MAVAIETVRDATEEVREALGRLLPQLNPALGAPSEALLQEVVGDPAVHLLLARDEGRIVGTATVAVVPTPARVTAHVNDVVVDSGARGRGVGRALMEAAIALARERGVSTIRLTSGQHRASAHGLYESLGFRLLDSRAYRLEL